MVKKYIYILLGIGATALGVLGIFIPGLPTVPFLLLASHLFYHSSPRLHDWVRDHHILGRQIRSYEEKGGMTFKSKTIAITLTIALSSLSIYLLTDKPLVQIIVGFFALVGCSVIAFVVKGVK